MPGKPHARPVDRRQVVTERFAHVRVDSIEHRGQPGVIEIPPANHGRIPNLILPQSGSLGWC